MPDRISNLEIARAYRRLFSTPDGGIVLADLEGKFGKNPFAGEHTNQTNYNCGLWRVLQEFGEQMRLADEAREPPKETISHG